MPSVLLLDLKLALDGLVQELFLPSQGALARDSVIICELLLITDEGGPQCLLIRAHQATFTYLKALESLVEL